MRLEVADPVSPCRLEKRMRHPAGSRRCVAAEERVAGECEVKFIDYIQLGQRPDELPAAFAMEVLDGMFLGQSLKKIRE